MSLSKKTFVSLQAYFTLFNLKHIALETNALPLKYWVSQSMTFISDALTLNTMWRPLFADGVEFEVLVSCNVCIFHNKSIWSTVRSACALTTQKQRIKNKLLSEEICVQLVKGKAMGPESERGLPSVRLLLKYIVCTCFHRIRSYGF